MNSFRQFSHYFSDLFLSFPAISQFCRFNRRIFGPKAIKTSGIILIEVNSQCSSHIAYSYLANVLSSVYNSKLIGHVIPTKTRKVYLKEFFSRLNLNPFSIYRSFGVSSFLFIRPTLDQKAIATKLVSKFRSSVFSLADIERYCVDEILVGDLLYDSYLRYFKRPTIKLTSLEFQGYLQQFFEEFIYWRDYINSNPVRAVCVSHCVYNLALPLRIAVHFDIPSFQINLTHLFRLTSSNLFAYTEFTEYPKIFKALPPSVQRSALNMAKERLDLRFKGKVGVDMHYSSKSAFSTTLSSSVIKKTSRPKVFVAAHCFFDSPHSFGNNLFPDFSEWLNCLSGIANSTDYDWYIKTHPDAIQFTKDLVSKFVSRNPKFTLLPADYSHHQIISEGITVALTTYGTIGAEYAALGVPVINASLCNPHIAYSFNIHPTSQEDYTQMLKNLDHLDSFCINIDDVYEYYFMRNIFFSTNLFLPDFSQFLQLLGGYKAQFSPKVYRAWMSHYSPRSHTLICRNIESFVKSENFRWTQSQYID